MQLKVVQQADDHGPLSVSQGIIKTLRLSGSSFYLLETQNAFKTEFQ
jgi:hypothetical protein